MKEQMSTLKAPTQLRPIAPIDRQVIQNQGPHLGNEHPEERNETDQPAASSRKDLVSLYALFYLNPVKQV
jgi:hypothetical protein